jgi:hypothetical protein
VVDRRRGAGADAGGDADCGAAAAAPQLPSITEDDAVRAVLGAIPVRVFLAVEDVCPICLDQFDEAAVAAAATLTAEQCATALQQLDPSVVGLRCGHPLHTECARHAIATADGWHLRCPLCREPVTVAGAASARLFQ